MSVICNATPLINFAAINRLDILQAVFGKVLIPQAVYNETTNSNFPSSQIIVKATHLDWLQVCKVTLAISHIPPELDAGEREVIALAIERSECKVLLDEKEARQVAQELGLKVIGTIGILLLAKNKQVIPKISLLLDAMIDVARYWVSKSLYQQVLQQAGELGDFNQRAIEK
jgi:predicted nucleic acid-binding protein